MAIILAVQINPITGNLTYQLPQKCDKYISFRVKVNGSTSSNNKLYFKDTNNKTFGLHFYYDKFSVWYDDTSESDNFGGITNFPTEIVVNMLLGIRGVLKFIAIMYWSTKQNEKLEKMPRSLQSPLR